MNDLVERLRGAASGLCSEDAGNYIPRGVSAADCVQAAEALERAREALTELLSGHDNLYVAHFGPGSNPLDDIAAKAARETLTLIGKDDQ